MPRRPLVVVPGVAHHITLFGNNQERLFHAAADYGRYLDLLHRYAPRGGVRVLGYCLMPNHVHLIAVPEHAHSFALTLSHIHSAYALASNCSGATWDNPIVSCAVLESDAVDTIRHVDLNPVRTGLASVAWDWPWSSARAHADQDALDLVLNQRWSDHLAPWDFHQWKAVLSEHVAVEVS